MNFNIHTGDYYVVNRNYEYIGHDDIKSLSYIESDMNGWELPRIYLFHDGTKPWDSKKNFKLYLKKFNQEKINYSLNKIKNNHIDPAFF